MINYIEEEHLHRPRKISLVRVLINSLGVFGAGFLGSIIVMAFLFLLSASFSFNFNTDAGTGGVKEGFLFPFLFSLVVFLATTITMLFTYFILTITNAYNYKKNMITFFHIMFFSTLIYVLMIPIYLHIGENYYENIFLVFLLHNLIAFLLFSIILELFNNYTHILLGVYSSFLGTIITIFLIILFGVFSYSKGKVFLIIFLIPIINLFNYFAKQMIELAYYHYYKYTGSDPIGNVFYQLEKEDRENNA